MKANGTGTPEATLMVEVEVAFRGSVAPALELPGPCEHRNSELPELLTVVDCLLTCGHTKDCAFRARVSLCFVWPILHHHIPMCVCVCVCVYVWVLLFFHLCWFLENRRNRDV